VIAAKGNIIELYDYPAVSLRYSMASLRVLEARFGSLAGIQVELLAAKEALAKATEENQAGARGPVFTILSDALAAGLLHVKAVHPDDGRTVRLGSDSALVHEQLNPEHLQAYMDAFGKALGEAFGSAGKAVGQAMKSTVAQPPPLSPGGSGTTSPQSPSDAPIEPSGP
jgi:hypothetical protein